jgi:hypothetical protein
MGRGEGRYKENCPQRVFNGLYVEEQAVLRSRPPPSALLSRQQFVSLNQSFRVSSVELTDGRGGRGAILQNTKNTTAKMPGPL